MSVILRVIACLGAQGDLMRGKFVPVERDPSLRFVRGDRQCVFDHKWPHRIFFDREEMDLQPAGVGMTCQQPDMELTRVCRVHAEAGQRGAIR